jgi:cytochrome b561
MQLSNSVHRYGAFPQAFHWLTVLCVVVGWLIGQFIEIFPKGSPRSFALVTHMTLGQTVVVLLIARFIWRFVDPPPALEKTRWTRLSQTAARLSHYSLYALLILVPIAGTIVQLKRGHPVPVFAVTSFPSPWPADRAAARAVLGVHKWLANTLLILAGLHAAAALIHHYVWRDRTLARMLPGSQDKRVSRSVS